MRHKNKINKRYDRSIRRKKDLNWSGWEKNQKHLKRFVHVHNRESGMYNIYQR
jgi:hypothetical protein